MEYGLIGEKLGHSYSKLIQEKLLSNFTYEIHPFPKEELDTFMKKKEFLGINVTIPYKQDVIPYLDEIDESAKKIGAVNTIVNNDGKLKGYNTDYAGFKYLLKRHQVETKNKKVAILGNGGASKAIQAIIQDLGCKEMLLVSRNRTNDAITYEDLMNDHLDIQIIINTTPLGMYPNNDTQALDLSLFHQVEVCLDLVYNPLHTKLIVQAKHLKIKAIGGLEMLVAQAKYALEYFKNIKIEEFMIDKIYREILLETSNLVFIGMPGSGKSVIAKQCAKLLHRECIDLDEKIEEKIEMRIRDYFTKYGETSFREIESEICKLYAMNSGIVISCGGGIILREENIENLKQNGIIIHLERDLNTLQTSDTRPLSSNREDLNKIQKKREPLYKKARDFCVQNNTSITKVSEKTKKVYENAIRVFE